MRSVSKSGWLMIFDDAGAAYDAACFLGGAAPASSIACRRVRCRLLAPDVSPHEFMMLKNKRLRHQGKLARKRPSQNTI